MKELKCRQRRTKKQATEEASRATFALAMPPPITVEAHSLL